MNSRITGFFQAEAGLSLVVFVVSCVRDFFFFLGKDFLKKDEDNDQGSFAKKCAFF